ncbi:MAG: amidohydrolase family protein [Thermoanaerobaculia bacterium]
MIVDFHNHYYPEAYLAELERGRSRVRVSRDDEGRTLVEYPGDYNVVALGHRSLEERIRVMDREGVDVHAYSLTTPGVHVEEPARGVELARLVNDAFAEGAQRYPGRFAPLAALPLQDPDAAVAEAERALGELGLRGVLLFSHVNDRHLDDPAFEPLFALLEERGAPVFIHPTSPRSLDGIEEYRLAAVVGFLFDTTVAMARLIYAGVLERHPGLTFVLGHLGGTLPYVVERMDRGFEAYEDCRRHISRPPSEFVRRQAYLDTVNFQPEALRMAADFMGADRLVLGSDYPHQVGDVGRALAAVRGLGLDGAEEEQVLGGTAVRLLGL